MNKLETIKRKIILKRQAIPEIHREIVEHEEQFVLLRMRTRFENRINDDFDRDLSNKLDAIQVLLED